MMQPVWGKVPGIDLGTDGKTLLGRKCEPTARDEKMERIGGGNLERPGHDLSFSAILFIDLISKSPFVSFIKTD